mgnify:CR=1 FL=1
MWRPILFLCAAAFAACLAVPTEDAEGNVVSTDYYAGPVWSDGETAPGEAPWWETWGLEIAGVLLGGGAVAGRRKIPTAVSAMLRMVAKPLPTFRRRATPASTATVTVKAPAKKKPVAAAKAKRKAPTARRKKGGR